MRITIDTSMCDLHLQCVFAAPEIFEVSGGEELQWLAEVGDELAPHARAAAAVCPAAAIEIEE